MRDLNIWYRNNVVKLGVETLVFRETQKIHGFLVVPPTTSDPGLQGVVPIPIDADHVSICKPSSKESEVYRLTRDFIKNRFETAISGTAIVKPKEDNFFVDIDINNAYPPIRWLEYERLDDQEDDRRIDEEMCGTSRTLLYDLHREASILSIKPIMPYLEALAEGGPIYGVDYTWSPFGWQFPNLDFKIVNNTTRSAVLTEALFRVETSNVDPTPVPVIPMRNSFSMVCQLINEGWGPMHHASLDLNLFPTDHGEDFDTPFTHHIELGTVDEFYNIQLADAFSSQGVEVEKPQDENDAPFVKDNKLGSFSSTVRFLLT